MFEEPGGLRAALVVLTKGSRIAAWRIPVEGPPSPAATADLAPLTVTSLDIAAAPGGAWLLAADHQTGAWRLLRIARSGEGLSLVQETEGTIPGGLYRWDSDPGEFYAIGTQPSRPAFFLNDAEGRKHGYVFDPATGSLDPVPVPDGWSLANLISLRGRGWLALYDREGVGEGQPPERVAHLGPRLESLFEAETYGELARLAFRLGPPALEIFATAVVLAVPCDDGSGERCLRRYDPSRAVLDPPFGRLPAGSRILSETLSGDQDLLLVSHPKGDSGRQLDIWAIDLPGRYVERITDTPDKDERLVY